jgi:NADPH:quinone reductase
MLANVNLASDLAMLAPRGRVVVVGSRGPIEIDPRTIMKGEKRVLGALILDATADELREVHAALFASLEARVLRPVVARTLSLADAPRAHRALFEGSSRGKIILAPRRKVSPRA